jgi:hypothetical protein
MKDSLAMISGLTMVRDLRLRLAELTLSDADRQVAAAKEDEEQARLALTGTIDRSAAQTAQANQALLQRRAGGRIGISDWQATRKRAQLAVQMARAKATGAESHRMDKELECSTARTHWRAAQANVERLRLLAEEMNADPPVESVL